MMWFVTVSFSSQFTQQLAKQHFEAIVFFQRPAPLKPPHTLSEQYICGEKEVKSDVIWDT